MTWIPRIASDQSDRNCSSELDILTTKILDAIEQILQREREAPWCRLYDDFIARTCTTKINKELIEVVKEELIAQNNIFNKKLLKVLIRFIN